MKRIIYLMAVITISLASCKKDEVKLTPLTSLNVANFVTAGKKIKLGSNAATINNNANTHMALVAGDNNLYVWPVEDSLKPYFVNPKFSTQSGEVYSLFLHGDTLAPEGIVIKENIPYRKDSTAGIRFINLSPNSTPLNITLSTTPEINEVTELAYKNYTEFKTYPGLASSTYTFEVRDANTVAPAPPLATFSLSASQVPRFANITLVIRGMISASPALGITRVNQDR